MYHKRLTLSLRVDDADAAILALFNAAIDFEDEVQKQLDSGMITEFEATAALQGPKGAARRVHDSLLGSVLQERAY